MFNSISLFFQTLGLSLGIVMLFSSNVYAHTEPQSSPEDTHALTPVMLKLNWSHQFEFAGFYAALKQGYYRDLGLDVKINAWSPNEDVIQEVISARADFAVTYSTSVVDFIKGQPIKLVMSTFQYSPMVLLSHEPINDLSQLSGKRVMHSDSLQTLSILSKAHLVVNKPIESVASSGNLQDFIERKVDFYAAYSTNEPATLKALGVPYYQLDPKLYGVQGYGGFLITSDAFANTQPEVVQKFKQASLLGWFYALDNKEEIVDFIYTSYPVPKSRDALLYEAKNMERYIRSGNTPIGYVENSKLTTTATEAFESGLITRNELLSFNPEKFRYNHDNYFFTAEEKAYLKSNPVIRIANDINWEPFEFLNEKNELSGVGADYFKLFEAYLGVKFDINTSHAWGDVVEMTKRGEYDMYSCAVATPQRKTYMNFTEPYLSFPMVLMARPSIAFIEDFAQLNRHKVAVVNGHWSHEFFKENYPLVELLVVNTVTEGLEAVIHGRAMVYSGNLGVVNYHIQKYGLTGLQVVGQPPGRFELAIGVQADNPILFSIMKKALAAVTQEQRQDIFDRWFHLEVVQRLDKAQLQRISLMVSLIVLVMLLWGLIYRYQKNKKQDYINKVHELTYASLIDVNNFYTIWSSKAYQRLTGYSSEELKSINYFNMAQRQLSDEQKQTIAKQVLNGLPWKGEVVGVSKNGESYHVELILTPQKNLMGKITQVWATRVDITDKKRIENLVIMDDLTKLYNRRYFNQKIVEELNRAKRESKPIAIAMLDIDHFKMINDHYGHQQGDMVLKRVSDCLKASFNRANDFCFRIGGEEFLVISVFKNEEEFLEYLNQVRINVQNLNIENALSPNKVLTISVGAGFWTGEAIPHSDQAYHEVDGYLYQAKSQGRNQVVLGHGD